MVELLRIKILKTGFRKLSILSKFWGWRKQQGVVVVGGGVKRTKIDMWLTSNYMLISKYDVVSNLNRFQQKNFYFL